MTNSNNDRRRMTLARSYRDEADYYEFQVLPFISADILYRGRLKTQIGKLRDEATRLEGLVYQVLRGELEE